MNDGEQGHNHSHFDESASGGEQPTPKMLQRFVQTSRPQLDKGRSSLARFRENVLPVLVRVAGDVIDDPIKLQKFRIQAIRMLSKRTSTSTAERAVDAGIAMARTAVERARKNSR